MLGKSGDGKVFGLARNQVAVYEFETTTKKWHLRQDSDLPQDITQFSYKNVETADSIGPMSAPNADHVDSHNDITWQGMMNSFLCKAVGNTL